MHALDRHTVLDRHTPLYELLIVDNVDNPQLGQWLLTYFSRQIMRGASCGHCGPFGRAV